MTAGVVPPDLLTATVRLVRLLRERGVRVTPRDSIHAADALGVVDLCDREEVRLALRLVLLSRPEDAALFDELFATAWELPGGPGATFPAPALSAPPSRSDARSPSITLKSWMKPETVSDDAGSPATVKAPSDQETLATRDFSNWHAADEAAFAAIAARIARRLQLRKSRRWRPGRGTAVDLRSTLRTAVRTHGEPVLLRRRERRIRKTRLLVLCDVSGSMEPYATFLLQLTHALQNSFASVESFVFATRLSRVSERLRRADYRMAMRHLGREVRDWSGGTRIGASVAALVRDYRRLIDRRTVVVLLSDGWDVGDPEVLGDALRDLRRVARRLIWVNPLMGAAEFTPATRGMQAALPHVDLLVPGHNLEALEDLVRQLAV